MPRVQCPECGSELNVQEEHKGRAVKCNCCGRSFVLRFTRHRTPNIPLFADRKPESSARQLDSTVSFQLPPAAEPPAPEQKPPVPKKPRKKPHREE
jgi:hypothetical protein